MKSKTLNIIRPILVTLTGLIGAAVVIISVGCAHTVTGNCVPKALFSAVAWTISTRQPVWIADTVGHWQAMGIHHGERVYLNEDGRSVWPSGPHNDREPKLLNLKQAMDAFLKANPWAVEGK